MRCCNIIKDLHQEIVEKHFIINEGIEIIVVNGYVYFISNVNIMNLLYEIKRGRLYKKIIF